jgi:hypothetical protein
MRCGVARPPAPRRCGSVRPTARELTALMRCAPIMHHRALATTRPKALCLWCLSRTTRAARMAGLWPMPLEGKAKCPQVKLTIPGRGFSSCCKGEQMESGLKGQFFFLEPWALSPRSSIWGEPSSGINTSIQYPLLHGIHRSDRCPAHRVFLAPILPHRKSLLKGDR